MAALADEIRPGEPKFIYTDGKPVVLPNFAGSVYALCGIATISKTRWKVRGRGITCWTFPGMFLI